MLEQGNIIQFNKVKYFKYIKPLGSGGTGDTHLFEDETTESLFAIKKYSPKEGNDIEENYERFVQEVKILFNISHKNIVRIYNHYLYPNDKIGYLQMEYVNGSHINEFTPYAGKEWSDIFYDTIEAFNYLETKRILHRDIRPENILIDINGDVKIIDFGFGKKLECESTVGESVILNWPASIFPDEIISKKIYNHQTEVYFIGKLFSHLDTLSESNSFCYKNILKKMCEVNPLNRYRTFREVLDELSTGKFARLQFTQEIKDIYQEFASSLTSTIIKFREDFTMEREPQRILSSLAETLRASSLEEYLQDNLLLIRSITKSGITYDNSSQKLVKVETIKKFFDIFSTISREEQEILLDNLEVRLKRIPIVYPDDFDVPF